MGVYGLKYEWDPKAEPGRRVRNLCLADGTKPHPRQKLRVAMNSYVLASGGGRFRLLRQIVERPTSELEMTKVDTRSAVVDYVRKNSPLCISEGSEVTRIRLNP
jgi:hypothetical protein